MNLLDSSFLCLDIGTSGVRGIACRIKNAKIEKSDTKIIDSYDTVFALKSVIDELEKSLNTHFESAYITGNLGKSKFAMEKRTKNWQGEHKITKSDIQSQISSIIPPEGFYPMHIIPLRYSIPGIKSLESPIGYTTTGLSSVYGVIYYEKERLEEIYDFLRQAHIQAEAFYAPEFLHWSTYSQANETCILIDLGAEYTTVSIWKDFGPVWQKKFDFGGNQLTNMIAQKKNLNFYDAEKIKCAVASLIPNEMDRFTPVSSSFGYSRSEINEIILPIMIDMIEEIKLSASKFISTYNPSKMILTGGGSNLLGVKDFFENSFGIPAVVKHSDATAQALCDFLWKCEEGHCEAYNRKSRLANKLKQDIKNLFKKKKPKKKNGFIPILPSSLCFDMKNPITYSIFKSGGISIIHVDIMDGFYVNNVAGSLEELRQIRARTDCHLHVHLMTENPKIWAQDAISAGADTVILSTSSGFSSAIQVVKKAGRRVGIAINPETSIALLQEKINGKSLLHEIDEVMIMTVKPGKSGQEFEEDCLNKISVLNKTRKAYKLNFIISVDGGINAETAKKCWAAGADVLISGSYLARASDFPLAVQSLLK